MVLSSFLLIAAQGDLARHVYPMAAAMPCPPVVIDVSDCPEAKPWAETAKALVVEWYPKLTQLLATDGRDPLTGQKKGEAFKAPAEIKLVFKKTLNVPAYASVERSRSMVIGSPSTPTTWAW